MVATSKGPLLRLSLCSRTDVSNTHCCCFRRKRSSSQGRDFLSERKSEDQHSICHRDDREPSTTTTTTTGRNNKPFQCKVKMWYFKSVIFIHMPFQHLFVDHFDSVNVYGLHFGSVGRSTQILDLSKSTNTMVLKYSTTSKSLDLKIYFSRSTSSINTYSEKVLILHNDQFQNDISTEVLSVKCTSSILSTCYSQSSKSGSPNTSSAQKPYL